MSELPVSTVTNTFRPENLARAQKRVPTSQVSLDTFPTIETITKIMNVILASLYVFFACTDIKLSAFSFR